MDVHAAVAALKAGLAGNDRLAINRAALALIAAEAPLGRTWQAVAQALARNGEIGAAEQAIDRYVAAEGASFAARFARAALLAQMGRLDSAWAAMATLPDTVPDRTANAYFKGSLALDRGNRDAAEHHLRDALTASPQSGPTWLALTEALDLADHPALAEQLEQAWATPPTDPAERANLAYAVGRARDQRRDYAGAFDAFSQGAAARRAIDAAARAASPLAPATAADWPAELIERTAASISVDHRRMIFVTGLPRSGTTLVEQIFASNDEVCDGAELGLFRLIEQDIGGSDAASFQRWLDRGGNPDELVRCYLYLVEERFGPTGRIVDKSLEASHYMGLLLALFPHAPIVWMRRDPVDCGWSAFRAFFARGVNWAWDLQSIGRRLAVDDQLFESWTHRYPDRFTIMHYEELVTDPERQIERLAEAAGLERSQAMLSPHMAKRAVLTASVSQVRKQINRRGIGVAEPYREWLGPMIEAYARASAAGLPEPPAQP